MPAEPPAAFPTAATLAPKTDINIGNTDVSPPIKIAINAAPGSASVVTTVMVVNKVVAKAFPIADPACCAFCFDFSKD